MPLDYALVRNAAQKERSKEGLDEDNARTIIENSAPHTVTEPIDPRAGRGSSATTPVWDGIKPDRSWLDLWRSTEGGTRATVSLGVGLSLATVSFP